MKRRITLVAGYTAGHVNAAVAVAEGYKKLYPDAEVDFVGSRKGLESVMVVKAGFPFHGISASPFMGRGIAKKVLGLISLGRGFIESWLLLRKDRPQLVIGFGGYSTVGVLIAAWTLQIPTVIHEANVIAGRANRLLSRFARRILVSEIETSAAFNGHHVTVVGQPVRASIVAFHARERPLPRFPAEPSFILVMGGSLGSDELNEKMPSLAYALRDSGLDFSIKHQAGFDATDTELQHLTETYRTRGIQAEVLRYIEDMEAAYARAHFVVTAAGANTLSEISLVGIPAMIVPLRSAVDDHQTHNARAFARRSQVILVSEPEWDIAQLSQEIRKILGTTEGWLHAAKNLRLSAKVTAVDESLRVCTSLIDDAAMSRRGEVGNN